MTARQITALASAASLLVVGTYLAYRAPTRSDANPEPPPGFSAVSPLLNETRDRAVREWRRLPRVVPGRRASEFEAPSLSPAATRAISPAPTAAPSAGSPTPLANLGSVSGQVWKPIGPSPITEQGCCGSTIVFDANGRVNSIAVHPNNDNILYLGSAGGGVWRSDDAGATWRPLTDAQPSLGIGSSHAIAIDPSHPETIYAGTSNFALLAQSQPRPFDLSQSKGILKSMDGGASWIVLGSGFPAGNDGNALQLFSQTDINTIIIDPADSDSLYLAAGRSVAGGLYRSADGGHTWDVASGGLGFAESLALDVSSPPASRVLYAGRNGFGVLRSTDGGQSYAPVLTAATPIVASALPSGFGKVMVALAPPSSPPSSAGQVVYVTFLDPNGNAALFESTNGGDPGSWVQRTGLVTVSSPGFGTLSGSAFSDVLIDPASPGDGVGDRVYWGGFSQYLSTDSGNTFVEIGQINGTHGDHQTFFIVPQLSGPSTVYAGDDGGIWRSNDQGTSWTGTSLPGSPPTINAGGLQIATLYALTVKQDATASVTIGGAQDSGILRTTGSLQWTGTSNDGIDVVFDRVSTAVAYSVQNCGTGDCIYKSTNSGATWADITGSIPASERATFRNRLTVDPSNAGHLYVGGSAGSVFRTTDGGASFVSLGTVASGLYISTLDVAPSNANRLVVAANNGFGPSNNVPNNVSVSTNALDTAVAFQDVTRDLPSRFVTTVAFDPNDANVIYATLSGFGVETPGFPGHVFRTSLSESEWTDISPPIDIPVNTMVLDGTAPVTPVIYVGTDLGVLVTEDDGASWSVLDDIHLPNAAVSELALNTQAGVLRAGTWGRGVFELAAPMGPVIAIDTKGGLDFGEVCAGVPVSKNIDVFNLGTATLVVSSVQRLFGSPAFTVAPTPPTPSSLGPGAQASFAVRFNPTTPGTEESASIRVSSNDPVAPAVDRFATGELESTPPMIFCPAPIAVECVDPSGAPASFTATATDNCAVASVSCPESGSTFPLGTTTVACNAADTASNTSQCSTTVSVVDTTPPGITSVSATPGMLWPPNHQMVPVELEVSVTDLCDPDVAASCHIASITSNEPILGPGSGTGNTSPDWEITGSLSANLRAERSGSGSGGGGGGGRVYSLELVCTDGSGNSASGTATVTVAHDRGKN